MERITPEESLQRISSAQQQGMMAAPAKVNSDGTITLDDMMFIVSTIIGKQMLSWKPIKAFRP